MVWLCSDHTVHSGICGVINIKQAHLTDLYEIILYRIFTIVGAWPSIIGWMHFLNSDDVVAVLNPMAVL